MKLFSCAVVALGLLLSACTTTASSYNAPIASIEQTKKSKRAQKTPSKHIVNMVTAYAKAHGIDPALAHAVVKVESNYNCKARNKRSSASGIMQTLTRTARGVGVTGNLLDCHHGLTAGMRYLKKAIDTHGPGCAGASAYNTGIHARSRCTAYGRKIMALMRQNRLIAGLN
jgi:Soluble lytic murein transglycosylase and related regulatory proteins (some contain LysM/invasin domains)